MRRFPAAPLAIALLVAVLPAGAQRSECAVTEDMIAGPWESVKGGFFQEMSFEREQGRRVFNSWLHQRPEYSGGEWKLENCQLAIRVESAGTSFEYEGVRLSESRLYLRARGERSWAVYKRVK